MDMSRLCAIPVRPTEDDFRRVAMTMADRWRDCDDAMGEGLCGLCEPDGACRRLFTVAEPLAAALLQAYEVGLRSQEIIPFRRRHDHLYCSYCGRSQHEVDVLVAGPGAVMICPECAGAVIAAMASWRRDNGQPPGPVMVPAATVTEALSLLREFRRDWPAVATHADIQQSFGSDEATIWARVEAALAGLEAVVAEGGAP